MFSAATIALLFLSPILGETGADDVPFADSLGRSAIQQERLDDVLEHGLIIGNGDINALVYSQGNRVQISLTKNDVWDARLLTENDPPLPTMKRLKELAARGWPRNGNGEWILPGTTNYDGNDSYHANPFPCPLQCATVMLNCGVEDSVTSEETAVWEMVRAHGILNEFEREGTTGIMRIKGNAGASNGFRFELAAISGDTYQQIDVTIRGTANARFFVDVMDTNNKPCFSSGWQNTPRKARTFTYDLPRDKKFGSIILYTWTEDGALAENIFERVEFKGKETVFAVSLGAMPGVSIPSRLSLGKAVAAINPVPDTTHGATIRALAQRNVFLIETDTVAQLRTVTPDFLPKAQETKAENVSCIVQDVPGDPDWPGMQYAVALAQSEGKAIVSIVTSLESNRPKEDAIALATATLAEETARLIEEHEAIWRNYWSASGVAMDDPVLEQNWYRSLYFLRCVTKPGVVSPGLFAGLINATPAWHGDYHLNYNLQQTFWSAYITNHCDLAEPYDRLMREYLPRGQWLARQVYDCDGAFYPHVLYAYEPEDPATCKSVNGRQ